jgi:hypothetical protein
MTTQGKTEQDLRRDHVIDCLGRAAQAMDAGDVNGAAYHVDSAKLILCAMLQRNGGQGLDHHGLCEAERRLAP